MTFDPKQQNLAAAPRNPMQTADGQAADTICAAFGPVEIRWPMYVFEQTGALDFRMHRHNFVTSMLQIYDKFYLECRAKLIEADPHTLRPVHDKPLHVMFVDASPMEAALASDDQPQTTEEGTNAPGEIEVEGRSVGEHPA